MSRLYAEVEQSKAAEQRRAEQRAWWAQRNQCGDPACIAELYRRRIAQLQSFVPAFAPDGKILTRKIAGTQASSTSATPLIHTKSAAALARRLFATTIQPSDWEDAKKLYRIARLLVPLQESGRYLTPYGSWIGADEFEIARTRRRFAEEFAPRVKREAARFPLRVVDTEALRLDEWDAAKHRFKLLPAGSASERERQINVIMQPALSLGELVRAQLRLVLDRAMPQWLPANEAEAEAIISGLPLDSSKTRDRRVYLRRELEIVGPQSNPSDPNFIEFTAKIVRMDLFADANLTRRLLSDAAIRDADPSATIGNAPVSGAGPGLARRGNDFPSAGTGRRGPAGRVDHRNGEAPGTRAGTRERQERKAAAMGPLLPA